MILAEKIVILRKKSGMSQEELADKLGVSRQSVSKWEMAQSIPDLDKILVMSKLFSVSTDALLKDDLDVADQANFVEAEDTPTKKVTLEMANDFLTKKKKTTRLTTIGVVLCILSPVLLLLLGAISEYNHVISDSLASGIGLITMFILVAVAVTLFLISGNATKEYEFLTNSVFETEYGVSSLVLEKKKEYSSTYFRYNLVGIILCILSVIPVFVGAFLENDLYCVYGVVALLFIAAIGVAFLVHGGCIEGSYDRLLQENDYAKEKKKGNPLLEAISTAYWLIATAVYLLWSFISNDWKITWIVWMIAGILYGAIFGILKVVADKKNN